MKYFIIPFFITIILTGCVVNSYPYESYQRTEIYAPANSNLIYHETNVYPTINNYNYYDRHHRDYIRPYNHHRIPYKKINNNYYIPHDNRFNYHNKSNKNGLIIKIK